MRKLLPGMACIVFAGLLTGCQPGLFPRDAARSPYERYLALRGDAPPQTTVDAFGREQPALRERLRPMAQP
jgi:hypothetical protein